MSKYSDDILKVAKSYNIGVFDVLFCHIVASGGNATDAYIALFAKSKSITQHQAEQYVDALLSAHPGMNVLISKLKMRKPTTDDKAMAELSEVAQSSGDELATREGLVKFLRKNLAMTEGKEAVSASLTLAKIEGYDKEQKEEEDRVHYFLPWVSDCRHCSLMQIAKNVHKDETA